MLMRKSISLTHPPPPTPPKYLVDKCEVEPTGGGCVHTHVQQQAPAAHVVPRLAWGEM